ncbi:MAG: DUF4097 family beta strand repeat protein [Candidatus Zixiibacteriota bacterium]|nr:MAG: DUF4097 family beta strand repeat protein [candidate division Zixibacteria bacterium]
MKDSITKLVFLVLLAASFICVACSSDKSVDSDDDVNNTDFVARESFSFRVDVTTHSRLRLEAITGSITITGEPESDSVLITGERRVGSESTQDAEAHLPLLQASVQEIGNEIYVKTTQPDQTHGRSYVVDYTITLPEDLEVSVNHVTGLVSIESVNNGVSVNHVTGQVLLDEISSSALVNLVTGEIEAEVTLPEDGTINLNLVTGNIELDIPQNTSAEFSAKVVTGNISMSNLVLQNQVSTPGSLTGRLGSGQGTISLNVVTGSISVQGF